MSPDTMALRFSPPFRRHHDGGVRCSVRPPRLRQERSHSGRTRGSMESVLSGVRPRRHRDGAGRVDKSGPGGAEPRAVPFLARDAGPRPGACDNARLLLARRRIRAKCWDRGGGREMAALPMQGSAAFLTASCQQNRLYEDNRWRTGHPSTSKLT